MRISRSAAYAIGVVAAASLVAGCSGATQSSALAPTSMTNAAHQGVSPLHTHGAIDAYITVKQPGKAHPDHQKSWVSPDVKKREPRILFVSDAGTEDVYMYSLPGMKLKGTLTGFSEPQGMCADQKGDVFVDNTGTTQVLEISRTGSIINTFTDSVGYPVGCAVDPATGNLAVANIFGFYGAGQVVIWPGANPSSTPTTVSNPAQYFYFFAGYGPGSDLWVSGRNSYGTYMVSGCGASSCSTINLSGGTIYFPGAVQYDHVRGEWVLFDQLCGDTEAACSYPVSGSGELGSATTYHNYNGGNVCDLVQGTIAGDLLKFAVGSDYEYCGAASNSSARWAYTAGGSPTNYATYSDAYAIPDGAAVSSK
ncbi:MAG: hypothetical protein WCC84_03390 [Candidatus Cybelea sp.]